MKRGYSNMAANIAAAAAVFAALFGAPVAAAASSLSIYPLDPIQGDPIVISAPASTTATLSSMYFGSKKLHAFDYQGHSMALYGFDINKAPGTYQIAAYYSDGAAIRQAVTVGQRKKAEVAFTIPAKLGGDTVASQTNLVSTLADENAGLLGLYTGTKAFWKGAFGYPVTDPVVTDPYGYSRLTGQTIVTHKGADFHAPIGTPVLSINRGVVRLVRETRNYGKTIIVDHGLGLQSMYMHLSKILVNEGELVQKGQMIGLSGDTGYAEAAHLHLSIRIGEVSIDPIRFLRYFSP